MNAESFSSPKAQVWEQKPATPATTDKSLFDLFARVWESDTSEGQSKELSRVLPLSSSSVQKKEKQPVASPLG